MADYKVYCLDGTGKISASPEFIEAQSDDEAIVLVRSKKLAVSCEIWQGSRLVTVVQPRTA
jgi:hypothetical protein